MCIYRYIAVWTINIWEVARTTSLKQTKEMSGTHVELTSCPDDVSVWTGEATAQDRSQKKKRCSEREAPLL